MRQGKVKSTCEARYADYAPTGGRSIDPRRGQGVYQRTTETTAERYRESQKEEDEGSEWTSDREDYYWAVVPGGYRVTQVQQVTMDIIPPLGQGPAFQFPPQADGSSS